MCAWFSATHTTADFQATSGRGKTHKISSVVCLDEKWPDNVGQWSDNVGHVFGKDGGQKVAQATQATVGDQYTVLSNGTKGGKECMGGVWNEGSGIGWGGRCMGAVRLWDWLA